MSMPAAGGGAADVMQPLHGVENGAARVDVERVAELVGLGRGNRLDAGAQVPGVVQPRAAAAHRAEQVAERPVAEEVERLVGDLELHPAVVLADAAAGPAPVLALGLEVRRAGDEAALHHAVDDLLDQVLELLAHAFLIAVGRLAEQPLHRFVRQHAPAEERVEDGVVQRLHRPVLVGVRRVPGIAEPARQQQVRQLRDEILEVDLVEQVAGELGVAVFHVRSRAV